jgi:hypothetical protein
MKRHTDCSFVMITCTSFALDVMLSVQPAGNISAGYVILKDALAAPKYHPLNLEIQDSRPDPDLRALGHQRGIRAMARKVNRPGQKRD